MVRRVTNWHHTQMKWGNEVYWIAIFIYFLLIGSAFWLERLLKWKFNIPKKREYTKRFNKQQTVIESLIFVVFLFGCILASITVEKNGVQTPKNPIPSHLWMALLIMVIGGYRGYMIRRFAGHSNEHIMEFAFAVWSPILIVIAYHATVAFF